MKLLGTNGTMGRCPQKSNSQNDRVPWKSKLNLVRLVIAICLIAILQGCHTSQSVYSGTKNKSQQAFANQNPRIVSQFGDLELEVRMATTAELPENVYKEGLYYLPVDGVWTGIGVAGAPAWGNVAVSGGIVVIFKPSAYFYEKGILDSIKEALINYEFTRAIDKAIEDRLIITFATDRPPNVKIDVTIQSFGLLGLSLNMACVTVSADFMLSRGGMEVRRDHIEISEVNRSKDAPPPQCAHLKRFAENDARLVKDTLAEYAEVLAVMVIDRIPKGNSK